MSGVWVVDRLVGFNEVRRKEYPSQEAADARVEELRRTSSRELVVAWFIPDHRAPRVELEVAS